MLRFEYKHKKQYVISRELFCKMFERLFPDFFKNEEKYVFVKVDEYITLLDSDTDCFFIINLRTHQVLNWYKFYHLGRCLETIGIDTPREMFRFLKGFKNCIEDPYEDYDVIYKNRNR